MAWKSRKRHELIPAPHRDGEVDAHAFPPLHWMVASVFLATGAEAALGRRRGIAADEVRWAPLLVAPVASATHVARALRPGAGSRLAAQLLNGVAIGVGVVGVASSVLSVIGEGGREWGWTGPRRKSLLKRIPSLAPLTFGAAGLLGYLLDREEREDGRRHVRLERRAKVVERLVPKRRARVDRIVVHV
jgi:hypothetical protein